MLPIYGSTVRSADICQGTGQERGIWVYIQLAGQIKYCHVLRMIKKIAGFMTMSCTRCQLLQYYQYNS